MSWHEKLTLIVGGQTLSGWVNARVSRGIEQFPSDFELEVTDLQPDGGVARIRPGDACTVRIGSDLVVTGYIDRYAAQIAPGDHKITVMGRSKCQDLVDCAAVADGSQIVAASVLQLAQDLGKPYGITAVGEAGPAVQQFNLNLGESSWEIIDRVTRYNQLLAYDQPDGSLRLAKLGTERHASGFVQGVNVQAASVVYSMDQRFSEYVAVYMSVDRMVEAGAGGNQVATVRDEGVPRFRRRIIASEQATNTGVSVAKLRAEWECSRRMGRSFQVTLTCDSWRDKDGRLWEPNTLAQVDIPALHIRNKQWVIGSVSYLRNGSSGTTAQVTLLPPEAFTPEPGVLNPFSADKQRDIDESRTAAVATPAAPGPRYWPPGPSGSPPISSSVGPGI